MPRSALVAALAACLLVPAAAAASAHEAEGRLQMPQGVTMRGSADLHGSGLLELERLEGDAGVTVAFAGLAQGVLVERTRDRIHVGLPPHLDEPSVTPPITANESIAAEGAGSIENVQCGPSCQVAFIAWPGQGLVGAQGSMDATLRPTEQWRVFSTASQGAKVTGGEDTQGFAGQVRYVVPAGSVEAESTQFDGPAPWASGRVDLVIVDARFDLVAGGTRRTVDARWWTETTQEAAGQPVGVRHHARYANLTLDGPLLDLAPGAPFRLGFPAGADARLEGVVSSRDASGVLTVAGKPHELDRDSVLLEGSLATRLVGTPPGFLGEEPAFDVEVRGEATRAVVSGASVVPWLPAGAAEAGGGLLALAGLAFLGRLFVLPLYHRLGPSDLLANPNRRRIHDVIRERPGVDVGALVAAVGLSRVLVRHHLRMLEAHRLVRATVWRRRRTYALAGERSELAAAACELKDATRRRIASAVARSRGATQKDLTRALGLSQRLVSYHLGRLEGLALVRTEGRNPRVYVATEALARALGKEDALARAPATGEALARALGKEGEGAAAVATVG